MSKVAFLGPEGTFSDILARKRFGTDHPHEACPTIEAVFDAVADGQVPAGLVPVENSSGGTIHDTVDLLLRHAGRIFVREELSLDIRIALLGRPGAEIRTVFSHFIQIKYYSDWLRERHPAAQLLPVESTAVAARRAADTPGSAALASPSSAPLYGLDVLEIPATPCEVNLTSFFVVARSPISPEGQLKTGLFATLPNECGSLHRFLGPFACEEVSLTRIVSRPVPGQPQTYVFYTEIEGGADEPHVARALDQATHLTRSLVSIGSFRVGRRFQS